MGFNVYNNQIIQLSIDVNNISRGANHQPPQNLQLQLQPLNQKVQDISRAVFSDAQLQQNLKTSLNISLEMIKMRLNKLNIMHPIPLPQPPQIIPQPQVKIEPQPDVKIDHSHLKEEIDQEFMDKMEPEFIETTFYNAIPEALEEAQHAGMIKEEDITDQAPYLYISMNALALINILESSVGYSGIRLKDDRVLTPQNCPPAYQKLFTHIFEAKKEMDNLSKEDHKVLKEACTAEASQDKKLEGPNLPKIMSTAVKINEIASQISQQAEFKDRVQDVLSVAAALIHKV